MTHLRGTFGLELLQPAKEDVGIYNDIGKETVGWGLES
jgi:hypothetical protein